MQSSHARSRLQRAGPTSHGTAAATIECTGTPTHTLCVVCERRHKAENTTGAPRRINCCVGLREPDGDRNQRSHLAPIGGHTESHHHQIGTSGEQMLTTCGGSGPLSALTGTCRGGQEVTGCSVRYYLAHLSGSGQQSTKDSWTRLHGSCATGYLYGCLAASRAICEYTCSRSDSQNE